MRADEVDEYERMKAQLIKALRRMDAYNSMFDLPLVEEIARGAIYVKRGEQFLDDPKCSPTTYSALSDAIVKHSNRMRAAIKDLAANRAERLKVQSATKLAEEIRNAIDKVIREG
jgi:hypothetical protein